MKSTLIAVCIVLISTISAASSFIWEGGETYCAYENGYACGDYILMWEAEVYSNLCPSDVLEEETDCDTDANCTEYFVSYPCQTLLKDMMFAKTLVLPIGYETKEFPFTKNNFPTVVDGTRYVVVVVAFERNPDGRENLSEFSNRMVVKLSDGVLVLKPMNIKIR